MHLTLVFQVSTVACSPNMCLSLSYHSFQIPLIYSHLTGVECAQQPHRNEFECEFI